MIARLALAAAISAPSGYRHIASYPREALTPFLIVAVVLFSTSVVYLVLWWNARDYAVFRNMGLYLALVGGSLLLPFIGTGKWHLGWEWQALVAPLLPVIAAEAMRIERRRWVLLLWPIAILTVLLGWIPSFYLLQGVSMDLSQIALIILCIQAYRQGNTRDRQIAAAFTALFCVRWTSDSDFTQLAHINGDPVIHGWIWNLNTTAIAALGAVALIILVRDLARDRQEKQRLAAELAAGRAVQQMLIPAETPSIPGLHVQAVYNPAGEVGGDFFQILPLPGGAALVAIGDVSGKGISAAMTVSLLVGVMRLAAESTTHPAGILNTLNRAQCGSKRGGFTTCLVLHFSADGHITAANAGHLAPYLDGRELALENGLPLGLLDDAVYEESRFHLAHGSRLTLMTDGIVEARNRHGELFGFERAASISRQSAESISLDARQFGQEDDITVLTLTRLAEG